MGTYAGIPVKVHWSFFLVILYIVWISYSENLGSEQSISLGIHIFLLFLCVVLHEYGHALAARKYGIKTRDIILSPIGGLARLESLPQKPSQQLFVAFAGPLVNLVLLVILLAIKFVSSNMIFIPQTVSELNYVSHPSSAIFLLIIINAVLFLFNLLPAYPMDGGRILKALLNMKYSKYKSTLIASSVGRVFAIAFLAIGAYNRIFALLFIGLFIYVMATREYHFAKQRHLHLKNQESEQS